MPMCIYSKHILYNSRRTILDPRETRIHIRTCNQPFRLCIVVPSWCSPESMTILTSSFMALTISPTQSGEVSQSSNPALDNLDKLIPRRPLCSVLHPPSFTPHSSISFSTKERG